MNNAIGLIDYDALIQHRYVGPNYHLGLTYAYLKQDPNNTVRLISSLSTKNLSKYGKIYIFKNSKLLPHPSGQIVNYYQLDVEEYGPGFINKPFRPFHIETAYTKPDFTCYNFILQFSIDKPKHPMAWQLDRALQAKRHQQILLYDKMGNEYLRRDIPNAQYKNIIIHDDPNVLFNNTQMIATLEDLWSQGYHTSFSQPVDISSLKDTNIIERLVTDKNLASLRKKVVITDPNKNMPYLVDYCMNNPCKVTNVMVLFDKDKGHDYYMCTMLRLNYYNNKTGYCLRMRPYCDKSIVVPASLAHYLYRFLYQKSFLMSFYEYLFNAGCAKMGVPKPFLRTTEEMYGYVLENYGMPEIVQRLEDWICQHPEYEEHVFIGGSSNYERERRKAYDPRRSHYAFTTSTNTVGSICGNK